MPMFEAGRVDMLSRFSLLKKLYGREEEVAMMTGAFDRVMQGATEVISGLS